MREFLTDEQLLRVFAALRKSHATRPAALQAASDADTALEEYDLRETLGLHILVEPTEDPEYRRLCLTGGRQWQGALVQCMWTEPDYHIFLLMPSEAFGDEYQCEVIISKQARGRPAVARIVPECAALNVFVEQWKSAAIKPSIEKLRQWIEAYQKQSKSAKLKEWLTQLERLT